MTTDAPSRPRYADDFHLWALDQAARLRALAYARADEPLDWEDLAEEIEGLARREWRTATTCVEQIIAHLLRRQYASVAETDRDRAEKVALLRIELEDLLTPSLRALVESGLAEHYRRTLRLLRHSVTRNEFAVENLPAECPYSFEQVLGADDWLPEPSAATSVTRST